MSFDPYNVLNVARDADAAAIKRAHRKRAKETHPDVGGDPEEFRAVSKAVAVLSDPAKRAEYDATGTISDDPNDAVEHGALNLLGNMLAQIINGAEDPLQIDIVGRMKGELATQTAGLKAEISRLTKVIAKLEKVAKKFSRKSSGKPNLLTRMAEAHVGQATQALRNAETMLAQREKALEILADHEFAWDKPPPQPSYTATPGQKAMADAMKAAMDTAMNQESLNAFFRGGYGYRGT